MANRKSLHLFFGIVLVLLAAIIGFAIARTAFACIRAGVFLGSWEMGNVILYGLLGVFCLWIGTNEFKRATGQRVLKTKFRWGRLLAGLYLVFSSLNSHLHPSPNDLKADNDAQAAGMLFATFVMVAIGLVLIVLSFKPREQEALAKSESR